VSQAWLYQPVRSRLCPGTAGSGITRIAAGTANMLALKSNGTVLAWGSNSEGQLGIDLPS